MVTPDEGAVYDKQITIDVEQLEPMITYGTNPGMGIPITALVPNPSKISDPLERDSVEKALLYMGLQGGKPLLGHPVNVVFIGKLIVHCDNRAVVDAINAARPDIVWVGLSTPKQEFWMASHLGRIEAPVMVGVGAAFDFLAETKRQAPLWMQRNGLEWLFQLCSLGTAPPLAPLCLRGPRLRVSCV